MRSALFVALLVLSFRFFSMDGLALIDPSEGRYAVIAQNMEMTGDWVTPMGFNDGQTIAFLGKPPLQFWLTEMSFSVFGFTAFAARVPSFLATLIMLAAVWAYASKAWSKDVADLAVLLGATSFSAFLFSSSCMLDPLLGASVAVALAAFGLGERSGNPIHRKMFGYLFMTAIAAGLLAKGPVAVILIFAVVGPWVLRWNRWRTLVDLMSPPAILLCAAMVLPWYLMAEQRTPGFLQYFLIHENFLRYLVKDFGDKYGSGHRYPYGTIWPILFISFLPWTLFLLNTRWLKGVPTSLQNVFRDPSVSFVTLCALMPCVFFTFAKQLTIAYVLPGIPWVGALFALYFCNGLLRQTAIVDKIVAGIMGLSAFFILASVVIKGALIDNLIAAVIVAAAVVTLKFIVTPRSVEPDSKTGAVQSLALAVGAILAVGSLSLSPWIDDRMSAKLLLERMRERHVTEVTFHQRVPQSAYFYGYRGEIKFNFDPYLNDYKSGYLALTDKQWRKLSDDRKADFKVIERIGPWRLVVAA